ncbi:MAG: family 36 glycosyl transferase, partial [Bacilli bacterium]|nr:family 36 glycosyl transferase [Bacilli bacterium]
KLFVETQYVSDPECLLAKRRPRSPDEKPIWAVHSLVVCCEPLGPVEYETDRACFIGRGHPMSLPQGIDSKLSGKVGAVLDPAFIMRRRVMIQPGQCLQFFAITGVSDTRDEAIGIVRRLSGEQQVERTFQLAWTRSQIELSHLHLTATEAMDFQTLASRALYTAPLSEARVKNIASNAKGQSSLWAHGVSGDLPIVLVRIGDAANLPFVVKLLRGHEYLRRRGVLIDLVILNESVTGYDQHLQDAVKRAVEQGVHRESLGQPGAVFPLAADQVPPEDQTLLAAVARVELRADGPSLKAQLRVEQTDQSLPQALEAVAQNHSAVAAAATADDLHDLLFFNGFGGFSQDGREYRMMLKNGSNLPAPWVNVMANPHFGCVMSELGTGYTWWRNSRECKLTPWRNDPVLDPPGEVCYLRDEDTGDYWSATPAPARSASPYSVVHGQGYTRFSQLSHGLQQELTVFVPLEDPVKVMELRVQNHTSEPRHLSVTYYNEWVIGVQRETNASFVAADWDERTSALIARNTYQETFRDATSFLSIRSNQDSGAGELSWTADRAEFLGRNGSLQQPAALQRARLSGKTGPQYDTCGAVQLKFTIDPGKEQKIYVLLGCEQSRSACEQLLQKYGQNGRCEQEFNRMQEFWDRVVGQISVSTPMKEIDLLLNGWLLYQTLSCRMWARTAFYQAGGAYGFRDQLQDSLALLHSRPELSRAQILLHAAHQYEEGDVQHWWHEETLRGIRTRYSDDLLWLPYAAARYIEQTGDIGLLDETVPFLHSDPLREEERERYEPTVQSTQSGTVFEHCQRAIDHALRFGAHGLPLMGIGDWNDGMNRVGDEGRGESVWLGWFLCDVLTRFADLCERLEVRELAAHYRSTREKLAASLNESAWDEQWYRRAVTDSGHWLGSIHNEECRIDAIAQSWSVISGAAPKDKALQAMNSFDRELVDRDLFVARLLTPPFDHTDPSPGYIEGYPPGVRENGGQYTHGVIWSIIAWSQLGEGDKAADLFNLLNPIRHAQTPGEVREYAGEPYVMTADIYTADPHKGRAGWTWYTGAAGWMYQAGIDWILGLRRREGRLYIQPCIPREWPAFSVSYRFGAAHYQISVQNPSHKSTGATSLTVDGQEADLTQITAQNGGPYVELTDDGQVHQVVLTL